LSSEPAEPLLASRSSAVLSVCRARAELKEAAEEELADALADDPDELDEPEDPEEPAAAPVPADAAAVVELEDVEAGVGEN